MDGNTDKDGSSGASDVNGLNNVNAFSGMNNNVQQSTMVGVPMNNMGNVNSVNSMNNMGSMMNAGINNTHSPEEKKKKWPMIVGVVAGCLTFVIIAVVVIKLAIDSNRDVAGDFFDVMVYGLEDGREEHPLLEIKTYFANYSSQDNKPYLFDASNNYDLFKTADYYDVLDIKLNDFWNKYQNDKAVADLLSEYRKTIFLTEALVGPRLQAELFSKIDNNDMDAAREHYELSFDSMKPQDPELAEIYDLVYGYYGSMVDYYSSFPECLPEKSSSEVCYENEKASNLYVDVNVMNRNIAMLEDKVASQSQKIIMELEK